MTHLLSKSSFVALVLLSFAFPAFAQTQPNPQRLPESAQPQWKRAPTIPAQISVPQPNGEIPPPLPPGGTPSQPNANPNPQGFTPPPFPGPSPGVVPQPQGVINPPVFPGEPTPLARGGYPLTRPAGFFSAFEVALVAPEINGRLSGTPMVAGAPAPVSLTAADLDWTGAPRIVLGYRFANSGRSILVAYRSVVSEGTAMIPGFDAAGTAFQESRLNLNSVDIDYSSPEIPFAPLWQLQWNAGVRIGTVYYDTRASGMVMGQRASSNFVGAGPHFGFAVHRFFDQAPGFSLYGKLEGAVIFGDGDQSFEETRRLADGSLIGGAVDVSGGRTVPIFGLEAGLSYSPAHDANWVRFTFGYLYEQWWGVGDVGGSSGDVMFQGLFFRGEFNF